MLFRSFPVVQSFPLSTLEDCQKTFAQMDPMVQEGYVVVDTDFNRIKCKHPGYVALHHLRDGLGPKHLLQIIRTGEAPEFLNYYPEWGPEFQRIQGLYTGLVADLEQVYQKHKDIQVQKDFALAIQGTPFSGALFSLRKGQVSSIRAWLAEVNIKNLMETLRIRDEVY